MSGEELIVFLEKSKTKGNAQIFDIITKAIAYKSFFDNLYGKGIMLVNWRMDGDLEPLDSLIESAEHSYEPVILEEDSDEIP